MTSRASTLLALSAAVVALRAVTPHEALGETVDCGAYAIPAPAHAIAPALHFKAKRRGSPARAARAWRAHRMCVVGLESLGGSAGSEAGGWNDQEFGGVVDWVGSGGRDDFSASLAGSGFGVDPDDGPYAGLDPFWPPAGGDCPFGGCAISSLTSGPPVATPEASTVAMMLVGFAGLGFFKLRRTRE